MKAVLMGLSGARNRGCEAIVRSVAPMLHGADITLGSMEPEYDRSVFGGTVRRVVYNGPALKPSLMWAAGAVSRRVIKKDITLPFILGEQKRIVRESDLFVSIGGDIYCYGKPYWLMELNRTALKAGKPAVLFGASVEPKAIDRVLAKDLSSLTHLVVRDSITYDALKGIGAKLTLAPDPAFTLEPERVDLPTGWRDGAMAGINVSPLVTRYEKTPGIILESFKALIAYILENTDCTPVLIPHVMSIGDEDTRMLKPLAEAFPGRVLEIAPVYNACQLKYVISKCRYLAAARTHASIAAYSSGVPALVLGYSVKARGIARDIFGSEDGLVVPAGELQSAEKLIESFQSFEKREEGLRRHLEEVMPDFIGRAKSAGDILRAVL
jgi:polysaccharide pyruvyl transferase WcaK-like protein